MANSCVYEVKIMHNKFITSAKLQTLKQKLSSTIMVNPFALLTQYQKSVFTDKEQICFCSK